MQYNDIVAITIMAVFHDDGVKGEKVNSLTDIFC